MFARTLVIIRNSNKMKIDVFVSELNMLLSYDNTCTKIC